MRAAWNNSLGGIGRWTIVDSTGLVVWASITPFGRFEASRLLRAA
jgi:hypothetical protein